MGYGQTMKKEFCYKISVIELVPDGQRKKKTEKLYNSIGVSNNNFVLESRNEVDRLSHRYFLSRKVKQVKDKFFFVKSN